MIIVIVGPTGVGKTKLSVDLAKKYNAEIINGDSMQVYKGLNIGTSKVTTQEKKGIPHHLFDIKEVSDDYSIYNYQLDCRNKIKELQDKNKNIIIVGGTGLYIKSVLYDYIFENENSDNEFDNLSNEEIYNILISKDKNIVIDKFNRRRLVRALNYYNNNNKSINDNNLGSKLLYDAIFIGLTTDRNILYQIINDRVDTMINNGLLNEVRSFYDKGIRYKPLTSGIGYKELYEYLDGNVSFDTAVDNIKKNTRHYAKRQYTFFNNQMNITWFDVDFNNFNNTIDRVVDYISKQK